MRSRYSLSFLSFHSVYCRWVRSANIFINSNGECLQVIHFILILIKIDFFVVVVLRKKASATYLDTQVYMGFFCASCGCTVAFFNYMPLHLHTYEYWNCRKFICLCISEWNFSKATLKLQLMIICILCSN